MLFYILILALGLMFIYTLRDALLELQNRRDAKAEALKLHTDYIIIHNGENCKRAG